MPSVDRVGRYFPLTIAAPVHQASNLLELVGNEWFECAEQVGLAGLDEQLEPEAFDERVKALGLPADVSHFSQGLPPAEGFAALLAGGWARWGWCEQPLSVGGAPAPTIKVIEESL